MLKKDGSDNVCTMIFTPNWAREANEADLAIIEERERAVKFARERDEAKFHVLLVVVAGGVLSIGAYMFGYGIGAQSWSNGSTEALSVVEDADISPAGGGRESGSTGGTPGAPEAAE